MACDTTSASAVGFEYMFITGWSTTAFGSATANRAIAITDIGEILVLMIR